MEEKVVQRMATTHHRCSRSHSQPPTQDRPALGPDRALIPDPLPAGDHVRNGCAPLAPHRRSVGDPQATTTMVAPPCTHSQRPTSPLMRHRGAPLLSTVFDRMGTSTAAGEAAKVA